MALSLLVTDIVYLLFLHSIVYHLEFLFVPAIRNNLANITHIPILTSKHILLSNLIPDYKS